jgi:predicted GNAT family acetyltransferase
VTDAPAHKVEVRDNPAEARFEAFVDGALAGFLRYRVHDGRITLVHTEVGDSYAGHGVGTQLARTALEQAAAAGLMVVPVCPFVVETVRRDPERYLDLVEPSVRARVMAPE